MNWSANLHKILDIQIFQGIFLLKSFQLIIGKKDTAPIKFTKRTQLQLIFRALTTGFAGFLRKTLPGRLDTTVGFPTLLDFLNIVSRL